MSTDNLTRFAAAVEEKGTALQNCWGFVDGTVRAVCLPGEKQRVVYIGHKRIYALKYQSVTAVNEMIAHLFCPIKVIHHDSYMLRKSDLLSNCNAIHMTGKATFYAYVVTLPTPPRLSSVFVQG